MDCPLYSSFQAAGDPCILGNMKPQQPIVRETLERRPSKLSQWLSNEKIEHARRMTPEERLTVALHLSDFCRELNRSCSRKP